MKTTYMRLFALVVAVICLGLPTQSLAAKGGKPGKPGGEDPPPDPEFPVTYHRTVLAPVDGWVTYSFVINGSGMVVGKALTGTYYEAGYAFRAYPEGQGSNTEYLISIGEGFVNLWNTIDNEPYAANNLGQVVGAYDDDSYSVLRLALWTENGAQIDLGLSSFITSGAGSYAINDAGLIAGVNNGNPAFLIIPEDSDGDGAADTWYADENGDGINDLVYPLEYGSTPVAINETGQILCEEGILLTLTNGAEYKVTVISESQENVRTLDINDYGQIVGSLDDRAVMWEISDGQETVTDLGTPSSKCKELVATGINNAGQIVGVTPAARERDRIGFFYQDGKIYKLSDLMTDGSERHPYVLKINDSGWILDTSSVCVPVIYP